MSVLDEFNQGNLEQAIALATADVKSNPTDVSARHLLCELLCFRGEFERADRMLDTLTSQIPASAAPLALFRQLIRAEMARQECYSEGRVPELLDKPDALTKKMIEAWMARRNKDFETCGRLLEEVEADRPVSAGQCNDKPFADLRDQDDFSSYFMETLTSTGKYYWIPFHRIEFMEMHSPERPRDQVWRQCHMIVNDGPDGEVYIPVRYLGSVSSEDKNLQLGRSTDWVEQPGQPTQGIGRRMFWTDEEEISIMEIESITVNQESAQTQTS